MGRMRGYHFTAATAVHRIVAIASVTTAYVCSHKDLRLPARERLAHRQHGYVLEAVHFELTKLCLCV